MILFHFIFDALTVRRLKDLCGKDKFSLFLGKVLEKMLPMLDRMHYRRREGGACQSPIADDPDTKRVEVWAKMPDWLYRKFKLMHQDLNVFSMAQIVREVLKMYLLFSMSKGEGLDEFLQGLYERWGAVKEAYRRSGRPIRKPRPCPTDFKLHRAKKDHHMVGLLKGTGFTQTFYTSGYSPFLIYLT